MRVPSGRAFLIAAGMLVFMPACWCAPRTPTRLAIVDVGMQAPVPSVFLDSLTVVFTREPQVALLERQEITRLLREQALTLAMSGQIKSDEAVKAGRLWATDAFLMLEEDANQNLRVRLVDARYGLKLWDTMFMIGTSTNDLQARAQALAKGTVFRLANLICAADTPRTVSISGFRCEEISKRWDWLAEPLAAGIEQQLALQPGIVVMERMRTRPLTEERQLVEGLPESLRSSAVIVDGAYRIDRTQGTNAVMLRVRCRRNDVATLDTVVQGSLTNLVELQQKVVQIVAASLGAKPDCGSMDPAAEAETLAAEASGLLGRDPDLAISLAEAAIALAPHNVDYETLIVSAYARGLGKMPDQFFTDSLRGLTGCERILRSQGRFTNEIYDFFGCLISQTTRGVSGDEPAGFASPEQRENMRQLCETFWRTEKLCYDVTKRQATSPLENDRLSMVMERARSAYRLCASTTQAIEFSRSSVMESVAVLKRGTAASKELTLDQQNWGGLLDVYFNPGLAVWPFERNTHEQVAAYLDELCHSDDVLVRMLGERAALQFYGDSALHRERAGMVDFEKARQHARAYVQCVIEAQRMYPQLGEDYLLALAVVRFAADGRSHDEFRGQLLPVLEPKQTTPSSANAPVIHHGLYKTTRVVSLAGDLEERLRVSGFADAVHFRRLVCQDNVVAVVYTQGSTANERCGIVRLNPITFQPVGSTISPAIIRFESRILYLMNNYIQEGPSVAALDGDVFVGFPQSGILMFASDGQVKVLTEERGLAHQNIQSLQVLDGKLYAIVSTLNADAKMKADPKTSDPRNRSWIFDWQEDTGVMEIDPKAGISRILFSSSAKFKKNDLDGRGISSIAADARRHALWVLTSGELFLYRPADQVAVKKTGSIGNFLKAINIDPSLQICEDKLLISGHGACFQLDRQTEQFEPLVSWAGYAWGKPRWQQPSSWNAILKRPILVGEGLILKDQQWVPNDRRHPFLFFRAGTSEPENLLDLCFPQEVAAKLVIRDIALSPKGLLILTDDSLYLVPGLRDQPSPEAVRQF